MMAWLLRALAALSLASLAAAPTFAHLVMLPQTEKLLFGFLDIPFHTINRGMAASRMGFLDVSSSDDVRNWIYQQMVAMNVVVGAKNGIGAHFSLTFRPLLRFPRSLFLYFPVTFPSHLRYVGAFSSFPHSYLVTFGTDMVYVVSHRPLLHHRPLARSLSLSLSLSRPITPHKL